MAQNAVADGAKNQYGWCCVGPDKDKRIQAQIESYLKLLKWGPVKLDDTFKDKELIDVK